MDTKTPLCDKYRTTKDYGWYVPLWVAEELETANGVLTAENASLTQAFTPNGSLARENEALRATIEQMDAIYTDIMENGPRCTCGEGDEWCKRCGKSIRLSNLASAALVNETNP